MKPSITNIKWDRIWIHFLISDLPEDSAVCITDLHSSYIQPLKRDENNPHLFMLNITNPGDCKMLPKGIYRLA